MNARSQIPLFLVWCPMHWVTLLSLLTPWCNLVKLMVSCSPAPSFPPRHESESKPLALGRIHDDEVSFQS